MGAEESQHAKIVASSCLPRAGPRFVVSQPGLNLVPLFFSIAVLLENSSFVCIFLVFFLFFFTLFKHFPSYFYAPGFSHDLKLAQNT